jgi:hypothetical protein
MMHLRSALPIALGEFGLATRRVGAGYDYAEAAADLGLACGCRPMPSPTASVLRPAEEERHDHTP